MSNCCVATSVRSINYKLKKSICRVEKKKEEKKTGQEEEELKDEGIPLCSPGSFLVCSWFFPGMNIGFFLESPPTLPKILHSISIGSC